MVVKIMENFPLSDEMIEIIAEAKREIEIANGKATGALNLFLKQNKLSGAWQIAPNGKELVKQDSGVPERESAT